MTVFPHRIHLSKPRMGGAEPGHVQQTFAANWLSTVGPNLDALEAAFAALVGRPAVALSCGRAGFPGRGGNRAGVGTPRDVALG